MKNGRPPKRRKAQTQKRATTREQAEAKKRLDAARNYWLSIERVTQSRYLHGAESSIAMDAYSSYVEELRKCENQDVVYPEAPKSATIPEISPAELIHAATLLADTEKTTPTKGERATIAELFPQARELLIQAACFLKNSVSKPLIDFAQLDGVSFDEILDSNQKGNETTLKLLPGFTGGRQSAKGERYKGLSNFIRSYYSRHDLLLTEETQRRVKQQSGRELVSIKDETGEIFISKRLLPIAELVQIRAWQFRQKRARLVK